MLYIFCNCSVNFLFRCPAAPFRRLCHSRSLCISVSNTLKSLHVANASLQRWLTVYVVCRMAEARSAVSFSFHATGEDAMVPFYHEALRAVSCSDFSFKSWKKRIGRIKVCGYVQVFTVQERYISKLWLL